MDGTLTEIVSALASNKELETKYGDGDHGNFLSGWQCVNLFASEMLDRVYTKTKGIDFVKYAYSEYDDDIIERILSFHKIVDGVDVEHAFPSSCGSTSLIFSFCAHIAKQGIKEIYYIPPIYFSMHYALKMFGIKARPISGSHIYEENFAINLPNKTTVLVFVDPLWFSGRHVPVKIVDDIAIWQQKTGSIIFVDGSFQYMPWNGHRNESTSKLDPSKTMRMICPTKILAIHGYRMSYALLPHINKQDFFHTFTNIYASSASSNIEFAREAMNEMISGEITKKIVNLSISRYNRLINTKRIDSSIVPDCGYFTFSKILHPLPSGYKLMTQEFFEQKRYPGYAKLNLISPSYHLIDPDQ